MTRMMEWFWVGVCALMIGGLAATAAPAASATTASASGPAQWIDVRSQGAKGDGVTDDTAVFQSALDRIGETGGVLFVPTGRYRITKTLRVTGAKPDDNTGAWVQIRGQGATSVLLGDGVDYILAGKEMRYTSGKREGQRRYLQGLRVQDLMFSSFDLKNRCGGINADYMIRWWCQNSYFINLKTGIAATAKNEKTGRAEAVWIIRLDHNQFTGCSDYAIKFGHIFDMVINNNIIEHCSGGIAIGEPGDQLDAAANTIRIVDNVIEGISDSGRPAILGSCWVGGRIIGNYFEANYSGDIQLTPGPKDGWTRGLIISSNTFQPIERQRKTGKYGPIHLSKTIDAVITGNFTTGGILIDQRSHSLGRGVNIASNILNNPASIGAAEGAKPAASAGDYIGQVPAPVGHEHWGVGSPVSKVAIDALHGLTYQLRGEQTRSLTYGKGPPSARDVNHQPGDLVINLNPAAKNGKLLFGWTCITAGKPGQWKPLYMGTD